MIVGVDVSSYRVDLAWFEEVAGAHRPQCWHVVLGTNKHHVIDRVRQVRIQWPLDVEEIAIEYPPPRNYATTSALMAVIGAITKSAPAQARVAWPAVGELRRAIGCIDTSKEGAHERLAVIAERKGWNLDGWGADERDALIACLGWKIILDKQEKAA